MSPDPLAPTSPCSIPGTALEQWYRWGLALAKAAAVPPEELNWFLLAVTDLDRLVLRLGTISDRPTITSAFPLEVLIERWEKRCRDRTPVQYLVGQTPWRTLNLRVTPAVLIPRPETELLVDLVCQRLPSSTRPSTPKVTIADLGTGSGAIALGLAELLPDAQIYGVDCSADAIAIAQQNGKQCPNPVTFLQGSWFEPLGELQGHFTALVSNPPYIPSSTLPTLAPEVIAHEPHLALDGGDDGLDDIRHLITRAPDYLHPGGLWAVEHMAGQGQTIAQLLENHGQYTSIEIHPDLGGHNRFVTAIRR